MTIETLIMIRIMIVMEVVIMYSDDVVGKLHCWTNALVFYSPIQTSGHPVEPDVFVKSAMRIKPDTQCVRSVIIAE